MISKKGRDLSIPYSNGCAEAVSQRATDIAMERYEYLTMKDPCECVPGFSIPCCPADERLRKEWLLTLEKEHESLRASSDEIAGKFKILSNSDRVEILLMLEHREHCMDEISRKLKVRKSAISYHLGLLKKHGLICTRKRSRFAFYALSREGKNLLMISRNL